MDKNFRTGKTIVGARGRQRALELERMEQRKKQKRRKALIWCLLIFVAGVLLVLAAVGIMNALKEQKEYANDGGTMVSWVPTIDVISEGGGVASERILEFVAKLEKDFGDYGFQVSKAVLPFGMMREVDVYVEGRGEYYKMTVDRGSAVQAEDAERMMRYLDENGLAPEYVDLRVEGKAYYK